MKSLKNFSIFILLAYCSFSFLSCEKKEQPIKFRVDQFKQTAVSTGLVMALSVQQEAEIGGSTWKPLYHKIAGFNYEPGYVYDILVAETKIQNPPQGGSAFGYRLLQVLSRTPVNGPFSLNLKINNSKFVKGDATIGFDLLTEARIDCSNLCTQFDQAINSNSANVIGKFTLNPDGSIKLVSFTVN
jgi:hypothetical protein